VCWSVNWGKKNCVSKIGCWFLSSFWTRPACPRCAPRGGEGKPDKPHARTRAHTTTMRCIISLSRSNLCARTEKKNTMCVRRELKKWASKGVVTGWFPCPCVLCFLFFFYLSRIGCCWLLSLKQQRKWKSIVCNAVSSEICIGV